MDICVVLLFFISVLSHISGSPVSNYGIFGGQDASEGQFPYQVSIQRCSWLIGCEHYCGGSIISPNWIVTAGHCWKGYSDTRVVAGILNKSEESDYKQTRTVIAHYVHQDYIGNANPNDICVMKLNESWIYNDRIQPIPLPVANSNYTGSAVYSGWGQSGGNLFPILPNTLQYQISNVPNGETCMELANAKGPSHFNISANVCTENPAANLGICSGDSGGPLAENGTLIGISSWGFKPCGQKDLPSVYTRVSNYIDWLKERVPELE